MGLLTIFGFGAGEAFDTANFRFVLCICKINAEQGSVLRKLTRLIVIDTKKKQKDLGERFRVLS